MNEPPRILVVAATAGELATPNGWLTLQCGIGPVDAAVATAAAIAQHRPAAILHVGIAGARRDAGLTPGALVIGSEARYCDLDVPESWAPRTIAPSRELLAAVRQVLPEAPTLAIGTSARVGGTTGCDVEAMEGFGVLRAAQRAGVPAIEIRAISNEIEESDRANWHFDTALAVITAVTPALVAAMQGSRAVVRELTFGYSPCPNDTFAFHALTHGLVEAPFRIRPVLLDIEELNRRAHDGEFDLTKLSVGAFAAVGARYRLLRSGAALGKGVGPLVVAREATSLAQAVRGRLAIPGRETTAYRLLRLAAPALGEVIEMRYDRILRAVETGEVDAGLIIHESRFTYQEHGLQQVIDLGDWWERETSLPVPLAGICARADLDDETARAVERAIRASVQYAFDHPEASRDYVRAHAQEMSDAVCDQHIALYVNAFSLDVGDDGLAAINRLVRAD